MRYQLYPTRCDLYRDLMRLKAMQNADANHTGGASLLSFMGPVSYFYTISAILQETLQVSVCLAHSREEMQCFLKGLTRNDNENVISCEWQIFGHYVHIR